MKIKFLELTSRRQARRLIAAGLMLATILLTASAGLADEPRAELRGDFTEDGELIIGSDLLVGLAGASSGMVYNVQLFDEAEDLVAEALGLEAGRNGYTRVELLWTRTGVRGCNDPCTQHDLTTYVFENYADAEATLDGRKFLLKAFEGDPANEDVVAEVGLPLVAQPPPVRVYPSNSSACLRTGFGLGEPIFATVTHQEPMPQLATLFMVAAQVSWNTGDALNDVRPTGPQTYWVPVSAIPVAEAIWLTPQSGDYQIILRWGGGTVPLFDALTDLVSAPMTTPVGGTYPECLVCPPPP